MTIKPSVDSPSITEIQQPTEEPWTTQSLDSKDYYSVEEGRGDESSSTSLRHASEDVDNSHNGDISSRRENRREQRRRKKDRKKNGNNNGSWKDRVVSGSTVNAMNVLAAASLLALLKRVV